MISASPYLVKQKKNEVVNTYKLEQITKLLSRLCCAVFSWLVVRLHLDIHLVGAISGVATFLTKNMTFVASTTSSTASSTTCFVRHIAAKNSSLLQYSVIQNKGRVGQNCKVI